MRLALWTPRPRAGWVARSSRAPRRARRAWCWWTRSPAVPPAVDVHVYDVADDPAHGFVYRALRREPGVVVLRGLEPPPPRPRRDRRPRGPGRLPAGGPALARRDGRVRGGAGAGAAAAERCPPCSRSTTASSRRAWASPRRARRCAARAAARLGGRPRRPAAVGAGRGRGRALLALARAVHAQARSGCGARWRRTAVRRARSWPWPSTSCDRPRTSSPSPASPPTWRPLVAGLLPGGR